jgi:hypothetical protein
VSTRAPTLSTVRHRQLRGRPKNRNRMIVNLCRKRRSAS